MYARSAATISAILAAAPVQGTPPPPTSAPVPWYLAEKAPYLIALLTGAVGFALAEIGAPAVEPPMSALRVSHPGRTDE